VIVRVWRGETAPENADGYRRHVTEDVFAKLADITGHRGSCLLTRVADGHVEFVVVTLWDSIDEIRKFAGSDATAAVVAPEARALLSSFDEVVEHYDLAFSTTVQRPHDPYK
jgi:heme-degrading monooxygenase HmoA